MTSHGVEEIAGRYVLLERLGSGGMGTVWRATDRLLERTVAVKEVHLHGSGEDLAQRLRRAHREARAIARVSHPHVINIHDLVEHADRLWLVMELVEGPSLAEHVAAHGPLTPQRVAEIGLELLAALDAVHATGVVHRDVKPANVLLRADGRVVLCDFGIVALDDGGSLTTTGGVIGSLEFLAPERLVDQQAGPPSDLFSLGSTMCALFTGRSPFSRSEPAAVMHAVVVEPPQLPDAAGPLRPVLAALLDKDPAARPSSAEVAAALRQVAATTSGATVPLRRRPADAPARPTNRPGRLRRLRRWPALLAALLVTGGVVTGVLLNRSSGTTGAAAEPRRSESAPPHVVRPTRIDAALPVPDDPGQTWLFSGNRYLRATASATGGPLQRPLIGPTPVGNWANTLGSLAGFRDHMPEYVGAIQHGATLQPGDSGGPLLDNRGNVVGINTLSGPADTRGHYYSIPIDAAHHETDKLMTGENANNIGLTLTPHVTNRPRADVERALRQAGYAGGMFVESTEPGGPVDGLVQVGDLVAKLNNTPVNTQQDVCEVIESASPGRVITADGIHVFSRPSYGKFHVQWRVPGSQ